LRRCSPGWSHCAWRRCGLGLALWSGSAAARPAGYDTAGCNPGGANVCEYDATLERWDGDLSSIGGTGDDVVCGGYNDDELQGQADNDILWGGDPSGTGSEPGDVAYGGADEACSDGIDQDCDGADVGCTGTMPVTSSPGHLDGDEITGGLALDVAVITDWDEAAQPTIVVGAPFTSTSAYYVGAVFGVTSADFQVGGAIADRAAWRLEGSALPDKEVGEYLGVGVAAADMDGDGISDVVASGPEYGGPYGQYGAIYMLSGPVTGSGAVADLADGVLVGPDLFGSVGMALATGDDAAIDGNGDLLVSASGDCALYAGTGGFFVVPEGAGRSGTLGQQEAWYSVPQSCWGGADSLGLGLGDLDGDGVADAFVGVRQGGAEVEWAGPEKGYNRVETGPGYLYVQLGQLDSGGDLADADGLVVGPQTNSFFARDATIMDDVDGDGLPEILAGAAYADRVAARAGVAYVIDPAQAIGRDPVAAADTAIATLDGDNRGDLYLGFSVANGGDIDGDGWTDAVVQGLDDTEQADPYGHVYVFRGPLAGAMTVTSAVLRIDGTSQRYIGSYGYGPSALHGGFDVNSDGLDDWIAVSSSDIDNGYYNRAVLFWGAPWP